MTFQSQVVSTGLTMASRPRSSACAILLARGRARIPPVPPACTRASGPRPPRHRLLALDLAGRARALPVVRAPVSLHSVRRARRARTPVASGVAIVPANSPADAAVEDLPRIPIVVTHVDAAPAVEIPRVRRRHLLILAHGAARPAVVPTSPIVPLGGHFAPHKIPGSPSPPCHRVSATLWANCAAAGDSSGKLSTARHLRA